MLELLIRLDSMYNMWKPCVESVSPVGVDEGEVTRLKGMHPSWDIMVLGGSANAGLCVFIVFALLAYGDF